MSTRIYTIHALEAAGFTCLRQGDTVRCDRCALEVSGWTHNMNPFAIHAERSPQCDFVQQRLLGNAVIISRITSSDENRPVKRQKLEVVHTFVELEKIKDIRPLTFSHWPTTAPSSSQMIKAGFFSCNENDRVICIYCNLICEQWVINTDDPCQVHRILSSNCPLVKSWLILDENNNKPELTLPSHVDYIDIEKRRTSLSGYPSIDKLAQAGFFYGNNKITCFYCNGSMENWQSDHHPIVEHVRWFPHCNYARQLCGDELYHKIQQSINYVERNAETVKPMDDHHRTSHFNDETLGYHVQTRLDLPSSRKLLLKTFDPSIIDMCVKKQLDLKGGAFKNHTELYIRCLIIQKQGEKKNERIIIPSKEIQNNGQLSSLIHSNEISINTFVSFEKDLQEYQEKRQGMISFQEEEGTTIQREQSLTKWSCHELTRDDVINGGWMLSNTRDYLICPHCHIQYYNWKSNDDLLQIHKYLSPFCLFVRSLNPFHTSQIPIETVKEHFNDDDIANAAATAYSGLVQSRHSSFSSVSNRLMSFNRFPGGIPPNVDELARYGFYYTNFYTFIKCFYCERTSVGRSCNPQIISYIKYQHVLSLCPYTQQMNDCDPESSSSQSIDNKCLRCMKNDKQLLALPCRHLCLCKSCGKITRTCLKCQQVVHTYLIVYIP